MATTSKLQLRPGQQLLLLLVVSLIVLYLRRPDQFTHPAIWVEDGRFVIPEFLAFGWETLVRNLAGYLALVSRLLPPVALTISFAWAPEILAFLAIAVEIVVVCAVAFSPTVLKWRWLCAVALLLVPSDPEVYSVSLYAFWWVGILVMLGLLWAPAAKMQWLRWIFYVFGGISSPLILPVFLLQALRTVVDRTKWELIATALAGIMAAAQVYTLATSSGGFPVMKASVLQLIDLFVTKAVGSYVSQQASLVAGLAIILVVCAVLATKRSILTDKHFYLVVALTGAIGLTVLVRHAPESVAVFNPFNVAPRYFFYSFLLLSWVLIWLAALADNPFSRSAIGLVFALSLLQAVPHMARYHDPLDFRADVLRCTASDGPYDFQIHYIGSADNTWTMTLEGADCRRLVANSLTRS